MTAPLDDDRAGFVIVDNVVYNCTYKGDDVMTNEPRPRGRPRTRTGYRQVHLYVPAELLAVIDAIVARKGISRNALICQMLSKATKAKAKKGAE